jgi:glycosyltransferase involved in cell wall biosynthesis
METILLISPYWREPHRWMVSSVKLAELWQRLGYRVVVACMGSESRVERVSPTLTIHRRRDFFLPDPWNYGISFGFSGMVRNIVAQAKPDLIVVNKLLFWSSLAAIPLRARGHRVVVLTDALVGMTWWPRGMLPRIGARIYAWTLGWLILLCAERVVTFHPQPPALLRRLGILGKTRVIPTGIDPMEWPAGEGSGTGSATTVTYVGRLESVKGVDDFLAAVADLQRDFPHLRVRVVGWHKERHPLVSQYGQHVDFLGLKDQAEVRELLQGTDVFVLPSHSEGLSNALMEAMASRCACIVTDIGGNRFLVQNGISGFLYPPGDREALKAHLRRLINDPAKFHALRLAARERIEKQFSWEVVGKQYRQLFEDVLSR